MENVVLINPFEVEEGKEDEFLDWWQQAADHMRTQPGFVNTRLHRAILPDARFRFINVAEWKTTQDWQAAISSPRMQELREARPWPPSYPSVYEVVRVL
jgi:heme-degrading monooxygenase HmoA